MALCLYWANRLGASLAPALGCLPDSEAIREVVEPYLSRPQLGQNRTLGPIEAFVPSEGVLVRVLRVPEEVAWMGFDLPQSIPGFEGLAACHGPDCRCQGASGAASFAFGGFFGEDICFLIA